MEGDSVEIRFYIDPVTGKPHIAGHGVTEREVEEVLYRPLEDRPGADDSRVAIGRTSGGRYLRVVYVRDPGPSSVFVVTAYELGPRAKQALRRRRRKKR